MTIAYHPGEDWSVADGAPDGVRFDVVIPSASDKGKDYRIARQESSHGLEGYIIHTPACPAWRAGHRMCWHVQRALENAEDPLRRFPLDVIEAWSLVCMAPDDKVREFAGAMVQSAQQAIDAADELDRYEDRQREPRVKVEVAIAEFDRGDPRERQQSASSRMGRAASRMHGGRR